MRNRGKHREKIRPNWNLLLSKFFYKIFVECRITIAIQKRYWKFIAFYLIVFERIDIYCAIFVRSTCETIIVLCQRYITLHIAMFLRIVLLFKGESIEVNRFVKYCSKTCRTSKLWCLRPSFSYWKIETS